jgi:hypothetical protein
VKRIGVVMVSLLAAVALVATPAVAKKHAAHQPSCKQIKDAIASGKSADDVAKDMKVTATRVKSCTAPPSKHPAHHAAKQS